MYYTLKKIQEKIHNTNLEKYGAEYLNQSDFFKEKSIKTCLEKYGTKYWQQSEIGKQTLSNILSTEVVQNKINQTKKQNRTFNTSQPEERCYQKLIEIYSNVIRQYRSDLYPFNCDFYIPEEDLYIEYQGSWTHGNHAFNKSNQNDIYKLNYWKSKNTDYYNNVIHVWSVRDVKKRNIAKQNKLNYLEFFFENEIDSWISKDNNEKTKK